MAPARGLVVLYYKIFTTTYVGVFAFVEASMQVGATAFFRMLLKIGLTRSTMCNKQQKSHLGTVAMASVRELVVLYYRIFRITTCAFAFVEISMQLNASAFYGCYAR